MVSIRPYGSVAARIVTKRIIYKFKACLGNIIAKSLQIKPATRKLVNYITW